MLINYWWQFLILILLSYFLGNLCGAIILSNTVIHKDIRQLGSKNAGTTNMLRVFGIKYGAATLFIDFLKGFICVLIAKIIFTSIGGTFIGLFAAYLAGLAVILGHNYPILLKLKGGKGFASGIGVFIALNPIFTIIILLLGIILLLIVDRMSIFALTFFIVQTIYHFIVYLNEHWWISLFVCIYLLLAIIGHRSNIIRLINREEKPLGLINILKNAK